MQFFLKVLQTPKLRLCQEVLENLWDQAPARGSAQCVKLVLKNGTRQFFPPFPQCG